MSDDKLMYYVKLPLEGATPEQIACGSHYLIVARCLTPEAAGDVVRSLCASYAATVSHIRIDVGRTL